MIRHNLKVAFRNLLKYKVQMGISIIGLSVGFACLALSVLWIRYEMTYDTFHEGADRIYFAGSSSLSQGDGFSYNSSGLLVDYLLKNCPEVEKACHISSNNYPENIKYQDIEWQIQPQTVDSNFISMFNIIAIDGDIHLQLNKDQIAITDKAAKRIFGAESPLGKKMAFIQRDNEEKTIVAVVKSWRGHSSFSFDILLPYYDSEPNWGQQNCYTLFRAYPNSDIKALKQRIEKIEVAGHLVSAPIVLLSALRSDYPKKDMNVKQDHIRLFAGIGLLVVICGLCNYLTILITRIRMRKRELALRKVNGASNGSLVRLILSELLLVLMLSFGAGGVLIELTLPAFKQLSQINENASFFYSEIFIYMLLLVAITIAISSMLIHYIKKGTLSDNIHCKSNLHLSGWFYKGSLLFQLLISIGFVFCTLVMMKQLNFLLNSKELGLERHNVGVITGASCCDNSLLKKTLDQIPEVEKRLNGFYTPIPKMLFGYYRIERWDDKPAGDQYITMEDETINQDYVDFFEVELLKGNWVDEKDGEGNIIINEAAVKALGWNQPIGKKIDINSRTLTVKGVIKDIYYNAPIYPVVPTMYSYHKESENEGHIIFKVKENTWDIVCQKLIDEARKAHPDAKLFLTKMEDVYDDYMKSEQNLNKLLSVVSFICILIAVFGIFSLVTLSCQQRQKEIAIRKVNGASMRVILNQFFKEYLLLLLAASCIAFPLGFIFMKHWLGGYMKQTSIEWWLYGGIFMGMALIIFLCIIGRIWRTARQNPAEVIKNE
ncbi:ABC transporter permease [Bacteroides sp.]|uniref:ABC transporter permease n=1 Tax=Bacteroides sp. TaxID=29523 RepID=UPI002629BDB9|nr:ABC transporter permease [Bacteroides sp.]MDD3038576.1 ABC transporter permease [Bacteroides sp.]